MNIELESRSGVGAQQGQVASRVRLTQIPELDGLRGIGILVVLTVHLCVNPAIPAMVKSILDSGFVIIELFFVLSGFLITRVLLDAKERPAYFSTFYLRRILRIWPLYSAVLLFAFSAATWSSSGPLKFDTEKYRWWYYATFRQNLVFPNELGPSLLSVTWSLAIEEQFYLVWPFAVAWLSRVRLGQLAVALLVVEPLVRYALLSHGVSQQAIYIATYCRLDGLACGTLIALCEASNRDRESSCGTTVVRWLRRPRVRALSGLIVAIGCIFALIVLQKSTPLSSDSIQTSATVARSLVYSLAALSFGLCVWYIVDGGPVRGLKFAPLQYCGKISYSLYLTHIVVLLLMVLFVYPWIHPALGPSLWAAGLKGACMLSSIFLVAHLTWKFIECPFMALKSRLCNFRLASGRGAAIEHPTSGEVSA